MLTRKELTDMLTKRLTDKYRTGQAITFVSELTCGEAVTGKIVDIVHPYLTVYVPDADREYLVLDLDVKVTHETT